ncbi:MAG TPA: ImmA/IrrE family metallo-endopeptidase, partial [Polyangiaceae bacterium]
LDQGRALLALNDRLGVVRGLRRTTRCVFRDAPGESARKAAHDGYAFAREARRLLDQPTEPLADLGVLLEERFEIAVLVVSLGPKLTAVTVRDDTDAAAIVLTADDPDRAKNPQLARVCLAHELCHILHDPSDGGLHLAIDTAMEDESPPHGRNEQRAGAFAAELLLPSLGLRELLGEPDNTSSLSTGRELVSRARIHFGSPWQIAAHHLHNHGYLAESTRDQLLVPGAQAATTGEVTTRLPAPDAVSVALLDRVTRAHQQGAITDGQAREALKLGLDTRLPWE